MYITIKENGVLNFERELGEGINTLEGGKE